MRWMVLVQLALVWLTGSVAAPVLAQDGNYVAGFAGGGRRLVPVGANSGALDVHLMANQDILLSGFSATPSGLPTPVFARLMADGSLRAGWGFQGSGIARMNQLRPQNLPVVAAGCSPDGERLVCALSFPDDGAFGGLVLNETGDSVLHIQLLSGPTAPFDNSTGIDVRLDPQGRYVFLVQDNHFFGQRNAVRLARISPSFVEDLAFRPTHAPGLQDVRPKSLAIDALGRIYVLCLYGEVGGSDLGSMVLRFQPNGFLDPSFSGDGVVEIPPELLAVPGAIALDSLGRVVLTGARLDVPEGDYDVSVVRLLANGNFDNSFFQVAGVGGVRVLEMEDLLGFGGFDAARSLGVLPDDSIIVGGETQRPVGSMPSYFVAARLQTNGQLDTSFGLSGVNYGTFEQAPGLGSNDTASALAFSPDGGLLLAGIGTAQGTSSVDIGVAKLGLAAARVDPLLADGFESP